MARRASSSTPATTRRATPSTNVNLHALEVNSDLIAFAMLTFAYSTESVNGVPGKKVPGPPGYELPAPAGPEGTFAEEDGGLHDAARSRITQEIQAGRSSDGWAPGLSLSAAPPPAGAENAAHDLPP